MPRRGRPSLGSPSPARAEARGGGDEGGKSTAPRSKLFQTSRTSVKIQILIDSTYPWNNPATGFTDWSSLRSLRLCVRPWRNGMFRGPGFEPLTLNGSCFTNRLWQTVVLVGTAAHTLRCWLHRPVFIAIFASLRETLAQWYVPRSWI